MEESAFLSIVITTYNRISLVRDAIESALNTLKEIGRGEIVVVDDCSTDETVSMLRTQYAKQLDDETMKLIALPKNRGVNCAKNTGAQHSCGEWVLFLDSDDQLISERGKELVGTLHQVDRHCPIVFFRSCDEKGMQIGPAQDPPRMLDIQEYVKRGTPGECLPVVRRPQFLENSYDEDLRGFEGLSYCRMIKKIGPAMVSPCMIRLYRTSHENRLSSIRGIEARAGYLWKGYIRFLKLVCRDVEARIVLWLAIKALYYYMVSVRARIKNIGIGSR